MTSRPSTRHEEILMTHLKNNDIKAFKNLLKQKDKQGNRLVDPNHMYGDPDYITCLAKAASKQDHQTLAAEFIQVLLDDGADPNIRCETRDSYAAIHFAVEKNNLPALEALLKHSSTDPNILNSRGRTALYLAASNLPNTERCFKLLATHPNVSVKFDLGKRTAIGEAARKKCRKEILTEILEHVKYLRTEDRQLIQQNYPDLEIPNLLDEVTDCVSPSDLYLFLESNKRELFKEKLDEDSVNFSVSLPMTFLQLACSKGLFDIVEFLIDFGADVNATGRDEQRPPVHLACYFGHFKILKLLIQNNAKLGIVTQKSLLHSVLEGHCSKLIGKRQHRECFDFLLGENNFNIPVNQTDKFGHTALHYAILEEDDHYAKELLNHGAYLGSVNNFNVSPLNDIEPTLLEEVLDTCIKREEADKKSSMFTLKINFKCLKPSMCSEGKPESSPKSNKNGDSMPLKDLESGEGQKQELPEMYPLYYISQSKKLRHLLKHPTLLIFLHLKWNRVSLIFYLNILFYTVFVTFLTAYILCNNCDESDDMATLCHPGATVIIETILIILFVSFVLREITQFSMLPEKIRFFMNLENWIEICIIVTTTVILSGHCSKFFTALTLLLSWTEVILQFGCIHTLAIYNELMKRVTLNYLKFLTWYSPLIFAFTLSFFKLYHNDQSQEKQVGSFEAQNGTGNFSYEEDSNNFYQDFPMSLLKTIVMMIGEFDASSMTFNHGGYFVFLLFVFMITIVLLNLLNGLAVNDTQAIKNDAELVTHCSKVKLVHHFENVVYGGPLRKILSIFPWKNRILKGVALFPDALPNDCLIIVLNQNKQIGQYVDPREKFTEQKEFRPDQCCSIGKWRFGFSLDRSILEEAREIADRGAMIPDTKKQLESLTTEIKDLKTEMSNLKELLEKMLNAKNN